LKDFPFACGGTLEIKGGWRASIRQVVDSRGKSGKITVRGGDVWLQPGRLYAREDQPVFPPLWFTSMISVDTSFPAGFGLN